LIVRFDPNSILNPDLKLIDVSGLLNILRNFHGFFHNFGSLANELRNHRNKRYGHLTEKGIDSSDFEAAETSYKHLKELIANTQEIEVIWEHRPWPIDVTTYPGQRTNR